MFKKRFFVALICLIAVMVSFAGCYAKDKEFEKPSEPSDPYVSKIKNVILMIGDGFGPNHLANAKKFFNVNKFAFEDYYVCDVTTYSKDNKVTDSAAAATALATGQKVNNGEVGRHQYNDLENIMEIASKAGKKTGIITSDSICGATPASFSAHANHRSATQEIVQDQSESNIDIFVGASADIYSENMNSFTRNGYLCETNNTAILNQLDQSQKYLLQYTDLLAEFNHNIINGDKQWVDYPALITNVLNYLDQENGFCLMIENGNIDTYSHGNDLIGALHEVYYFALMFEVVSHFCAGRDDTVVLVTADHETGGLQLANKKANLTDELYTSVNHTDVNVNLFLKQSIDNEKKDYRQVINNTDIFNICKELIEQGVLNFDLLI